MHSNRISASSGINLTHLFWSVYLQGGIHQEISCCISTLPFVQREALSRLEAGMLTPLSSPTPPGSKRFCQRGTPLVIDVLAGWKLRAPQQFLLKQCSLCLTTTAMGDDRVHYGSAIILEHSSSTFKLKKDLCSEVMCNDSSRVRAAGVVRM